MFELLEKNKHVIYFHAMKNKAPYSIKTHGQAKTTKNRGACAYIRKENTVGSYIVW